MSIVVDLLSCNWFKVGVCLGGCGLKDKFSKSMFSLKIIKLKNKKKLNIYFPFKSFQVFGSLIVVRLLDDAVLIEAVDLMGSGEDKFEFSVDIKSISLIRKSELLVAFEVGVSKLLNCTWFEVIDLSKKLLLVKSVVLLENLQKINFIKDLKIK